MILFEHDLGCHVTWCTRILRVVLRLPNPGNAKISQSEIAIGIKDQIFGLDISMDDSLHMDGLECFNQACDKKLRLLMCKLANPGMMIPQVSTHH